jgi:hypothetical protein
MSTDDPLKNWQLDNSKQDTEQWKLEDAEQDLDKHLQLQPGSQARIGSRLSMSATPSRGGAIGCCPPC